MTKDTFLARVAAKKGYHSIAENKVAPDNITGDPLEKWYLLLNVLNADGTMGKTFVYYLVETATQEHFFYNKEEEALDAREAGTELKRSHRLKKHLEDKYFAAFIGGVVLEPDNAFAEAVVFTLGVDNKLTKKSVVVFKKGTNAVNDYDVI